MLYNTWALIYISYRRLVYIVQFFVILDFLRCPKNKGAWPPYLIENRLYITIGVVSKGRFLMAIYKILRAFVCEFKKYFISITDRVTPVLLMKTCSKKLTDFSEFYQLFLWWLLKNLDNIFTWYLEHLRPTWNTFKWCNLILG